MSLRINQNIPAMNAYNNLATNSNMMSKSLERLSSGFRINRAADDAAGLSVSEGLRAQIGGLKVAAKNAQDGINVVQTAEGSMNEVHSILQRMRDLSVQASNSGSQDISARSAAQQEVTQLNAELDRIGNTTRFGGQALLNGTSAAATGSVTPTSTGVASAGTTFTVAGSFNDTAGTSIDLSAGIAVAVPAGTGNNYSTTSSYQTAIQGALDTAFTTAGAAALPPTTFTPGTIKATVTDTGNGSWQVDLDSNAVGTGNQFTVAIGSTTAGVGGATATVPGAALTTSAAQSDTFTGNFQIGSNQGESLGIQFAGINSTILATKALNLSSGIGASAAISTIDAAIQTVSKDRANLGAYQNRFEHTIASINVAVQNLSASESQIRDTDMASEMVSYTRNQILSQAGTSMLAQANQAPQSVLKLLQ
jgi:flagellin